MTRGWLARAAMTSALALATLGSPRAAHAQSKAAAEALFDAGRKLMGAAAYAEACTKFEESQRLDPGIGTLLYLAECYEKSGRTASAWATFREAASAARAAGQTKREEVGEERARALEATLAKLTVNVAPGSSAIAGLSVTRGRVPIDRAAWGLALPVDPGEYVLEATAPGHTPFTATIVINASDATATVEIPVLTPEAAPKAAPAPARPAEEAPRPAPKAESDLGHRGDASDSAGDGSGQRTFGLVLGGLGVVGLGLGTYFGLSAGSKNADAVDKFCPKGDVCHDREGVTLTDEAKDAANISTLAFGIGGAALVGGLVLYFTAPSGKTTAALTPIRGGAAASMAGQF